MKTSARTALGVAATAALVVLVSGAPAHAAEPGVPPGLPFDPFESGPTTWTDLPGHVVCGVDGTGVATLTVALADDFMGGGEVAVTAVALADTPSSLDALDPAIVIWTGSLNVPPGTWGEIAVPIDDRGVALLIDTDGYTDSWTQTAHCQVPPTEPTREGNELTLPALEGVSYFAVPRLVDGQEVGCFIDGGHFVGCWDHEGRDLALTPSSGVVEIPEGGMRVLSFTDERKVFDFGIRNEPVQTHWTYDHEIVVITPPAPTQQGNVVTIPQAEGVEYQDEKGNALEPGDLVLEQDLTVVAVPTAGYAFAEGSQQSWQFTYTPAEPPVTLVTPPAPSQDGNSVTIPDVPGVDYIVRSGDSDGELVTPGTLTLTEDVVITAVPQEGYAFPPEAETQWTFTFTAPEAPSEPEQPSESERPAEPEQKPSTPPSAPEGDADNGADGPRDPKAEEQDRPLAPTGGAQQPWLAFLAAVAVAVGTTAIRLGMRARGARR